MNLIPFKTKRSYLGRLPQFGLLRSEMDRLFDRFFEPGWGTGELAFEGAWVPSVDLSESDDEITLCAELPGMGPQDVEVTVTGNMLTLAGSKKESAEEKGEDYCQCERRFGAFRRTIELPAYADLENVAATQRDGVLTIRVPKLEKARARKIAIKGETRPQSIAAPKPEPRRAVAVT